MSRAEKAAELFLQGYNCAQAVAVAFCDLMGMDAHTAAKLSSSFGGGMGRLREVCGAVSGMLMVVGVLYGYDQADAVEKILMTNGYEEIKSFQDTQEIWRVVEGVINN